jgi:hypothetical protein
MSQAFDKNSLWGEFKIRKTESNVKIKNHKIWGAFLNHPGENLTRSFRSGIRTTKDKTSALHSRSIWTLCPCYGQTTPSPIHPKKIHGSLSPHRNPSVNQGQGRKNQRRSVVLKKWWRRLWVEKKEHRWLPIEIMHTSLKCTLLTTGSSPQGRDMRVLCLPRHPCWLTWTSLVGSYLNWGSSINNLIRWDMIARWIETLFLKKVMGFNI